MVFNTGKLEELLKSSNSDGKRSSDGQGSSSSANQADLRSGQTDVTTQENAASRSTDHSDQADLPQVQEFLQYLRQVHGCSDCDEADIEEWIQLGYDDQGYRLLNDEQIMAAVTQNENDNNSMRMIMMKQRAQSMFLPMVKSIQC